MTKQPYQAEWVDHMGAYRVYDPERPQQTVAYVDEADLRTDVELANYIQGEQKNG